LSTPRALRLANAVFWIVAGGACSVLWRRDGAWWSLLLAACFFLRAPVAYRYPTRWSSFRRPVGERDVARGSFTVADSLLSIASFLLLVGGAIAYAVATFG
jgi:hypothetical protein